MATTLLGYGPHTIASDGDFDIACVRGVPKRAKRLVISLTRTGGTFTVTSRAQGSSGAFGGQELTKQDGTSDSDGALTATETVYCDATGKDIRITTSGTAGGTLHFAVAHET